MICKQACATFHQMLPVWHLLGQNLADSSCKCYEPISWPARFRNLTVVTFFYFNPKEQLFRNLPQTFLQISTKVREACGALAEEDFRKCKTTLKLDFMSCLVKIERGMQVRWTIANAEMITLRQMYGQSNQAYSWGYRLFKLLPFHTLLIISMFYRKFLISPNYTRDADSISSRTYSINIFRYICKMFSIFSSK